MDLVKNLRRVDEEIDDLFSITISFPISSLTRRVCQEVKDKYDWNYFFYQESLTKEDYKFAYNYQLNNGDDFLKFFGKKRLKETFGLEEAKEITMVLSSNQINWSTNKDVVIKRPTLKEIIDLEIKHYGPIYGEDFCKRNISYLYKHIPYYGAYIKDKLVSVCYAYESKGYLCIDHLLTDKDYRKQKIATTLLGYLVHKFKDDIIFLHADDDDTPKLMYEKLGFETKDYTYDYFLKIRRKEE